MRSFFQIFALLFSLLIQGSFATVHTACYNYFMKKDGCVFSAADNRNRCNADAKKQQTVHLFSLKGHTRAKREINSLNRRYDATNPSFYVAGGDGICGNYDTNEEDGACLWSGTSSSGSNPSTAGWLNSAKTSNCGKRLYIQRTGDPSKTVYVKVKDGCSFNTFSEETGCFQIALTNKTFLALNPTADEISRMAINGLTWDFDNLHGASPSQGPV